MELILIAVAVVGISAARPAAAQETADRATIPPAVVAALDNSRDCPVRLGVVRTTPVLADRIPTEVRGEAVKWIRRVVRPSWVPDDISSRLRGEIRVRANVFPNTSECLVAESPSGGGALAIEEDARSVKVLWANPNITVGDEPGKTALLLAQVLLNVPEEEAPRMKADLRAVSGAGMPLFCGQITVPIEPLARDQWENTPAPDPFWHAQWYHAMVVWIAPGYFYVSALERTGRPLTNPSAQPGLPPRFLPVEGQTSTGPEHPPTPVKE